MRVKYRLLFNYEWNQVSLYLHFYNFLTDVKTEYKWEILILYFLYSYDNNYFNVHCQDRMVFECLYFFRKCN